MQTESSGREQLSSRASQWYWAVGLGGFADDFDEAVAIPYEDIPGFVRSTAQGTPGDS
jgi:hypothetical protein